MFTSFIWRIQTKKVYVDKVKNLQQKYSQCWFELIVKRSKNSLTKANREGEAREGGFQVGFRKL